MRYIRYTGRNRKAVAEFMGTKVVRNSLLDHIEVPISPDKSVLAFPGDTIVRMPGNGFEVLDRYGRYWK